ncbi:hypothetical protein OZ410_00050 [Robiginitalea sp. M366]|uniref:hypothetical protein n=1 Tax=Robiginitalea aestuariiviva TaxID=3036903 RepID=UPI00240D407F|nr:hypothetical protein [Robiginitalea aestuariiviva]MDG1570691.1 hypothetical protein [Robiginitalea aestuariiviva]
MRKIISLLWVGSALVTYPVNAQQESAKTSGFEFQVGFPVIGPANAMARYFREQGYDENVSGFFGNVGYPVKRGPRGYFALGYRRNLGSGHSAGLEATYAQLGQVTGVRSGSAAEVGFNSVGLGAYYGITATPWLLQAGPQLMFNTAYAPEGDAPEDHSVTVGLKMRLGIHLWQRPGSYGTLGGFYVLSYGTALGSYTSSGSWPADLEAPTVSYGYGALQLTMGLRF